MAWILCLRRFPHFYALKEASRENPGTPSYVLTTAASDPSLRFEY
jgi:hypothetical protein